MVQRRHPPWLVGVAQRPHALEAVYILRDAGYLRMEGLWPENVSASLAAEARELWPTAAPPGYGPRTPLDDTHRLTMRTPVATGPHLSELLGSLTGFARALSGRMLVPEFGAYGYYPIDDRCVLHLDSEGCDLTLLTQVLGTLGPLHVHPELEGKTTHQLGQLECAAGWDRKSGIPLTYPTSGVLALAGRRLPHHRPGQRVSELCAVAALHYRSILALPRCSVEPPTEESPTEEGGAES